jgi:lipopolysaccharide transport system ATP-binding protein
VSSRESAIRVENLGKCYQIYASPRDRLKQFVVPNLQQLFRKPRQRYFREFWALRDVSFDVRAGETVGIIGKNGAGKSTLLQLICGTATPSLGAVATQGRLAALLELGTGFNPDFTGRENAYLSCQLLGLSSDEAHAVLPRIEEFADIGYFMDQPVKYYSSGMFVRLAFAVSTCVEPDILVVDEALAVGDIRFQAKCFSRLHKLQDRGCAIVLVSHSTEQIARHCDRALLIDSGRLLASGAPKDISNQYMDLIYGTADAGEGTGGGADSSQPAAVCDARLEKLGFDAGSEDLFCRRPLYNPSEYRWGDGRASILDFCLKQSDGRAVNQIESGSVAELFVKVLFRSDVRFPVFGFYLKTIDGMLLSGCNSRENPARNEVRRLPVDSGQFVVFRVGLALPLAEGHYMLSLGVAEDVEGELVPLDRRYDAILLSVHSRAPSFGLINLGLTCDVFRCELNLRPQQSELAV